MSPSRSASASPSTARGASTSLRSSANTRSPEASGTRAAAFAVSRSVSGSTEKPSSAAKRARRSARRGSLSYASGPITRRVRDSTSALPPSGSIRSPPSRGRAIALIVKSRRARSSSIVSPWSGAKS